MKYTCARGSAGSRAHGDVRTGKRWFSTRVLTDDDLDRILAKEKGNPSRPPVNSSSYRRGNHSERNFSSVRIPSFPENFNNFSVSPHQYLPPGHRRPNVYLSDYFTDYPSLHQSHSYGNFYY